MKVDSIGEGGGWGDFMPRSNMSLKQTDKWEEVEEGKKAPSSEERRP